VRYYHIDTFATMTIKDIPYRPGARRALEEQEEERESFHTEGEEAVQQDRRVVFESPSAYSPLIYILLAFVICSMIGSYAMVYFDGSVSDQDKEDALWSLGSSFLFVIPVFVLVLPLSLQVRSDASVGVKTLFVTWTFDKATAAYEDPAFMEQCRRPRFKFATALQGRVLVRRLKGKWDVLVSPEDPKGFVDTVFRVAAQVEERDVEA
jgi:hypothetical protein